MKIYSLLILNKAGGLIYQNDINPGLAKLSANDYLVLAGTLHGVHAIATKLRSHGSHISNEDTNSVNSSIITSGKARSPNTNSSGLQHVDTELFSLYVFQTCTGLKFIIVTTPAKSSIITSQDTAPSPSKKQFIAVSGAYKEFYLYYCDYVMKNPFYSLDMPIKCSMFDHKVKDMAAHPILK